MSAVSAVSVVDKNKNLYLCESVVHLLSTMKKYYKSNIPWVGGVFLFEEKENKTISTYFTDGTPFCYCSFVKGNKNFTTRKGPCPKCNIKCEKHIEKYNIQANPTYLKHALRNKNTHMACAFCQLEKTKKMDVHVKRFLMSPYTNIPEFSFIDHNDKLFVPSKETMKQIGYWCGNPMIDPFYTFKLICAGEDDAIIKKTKMEHEEHTPNYEELADSLFYLYENERTMLFKKYTRFDSGLYSYVGLLDNNTVFKINDIAGFKTTEKRTNYLKKLIGDTNKAAEYGLSSRIIYHKLFKSKDQRDILITFTERIVGIGFNEYYQNEERTLVELEKLFHDIASRITELHSHGIAHGDMSGRNTILVGDTVIDKQYTAMFIDFTPTSFFDDVDVMDEKKLSEKVVNSFDEIKRELIFKEMDSQNDLSTKLDNVHKIIDDFEKKEMEYFSEFKTVIKSEFDFFKMSGYIDGEVSQRPQLYKGDEPMQMYLLSKTVGYLCVAWMMNLLKLVEVFGIKDQKTNPSFIYSTNVLVKPFLLKQMLIKLVKTTTETENEYRKLMEREVFPVSNVYKRGEDYVSNIISFLLDESFDKNTKKLVYEPFVYMIVTMVFLAKDINIDNETYDLEPFSERNEFISF